MHSKRLLVAVIVLPLIYLYISKLPPVFFLALLTLIAVLAQIEFYAMYNTKKLISAVGIVSGTFLLAAFPFYLKQVASRNSTALFYPVLFMLAFMLIAATRLFSIKEPESSLADIAPAVTGFLYIPNLLLPQWYLRLQGYEWILLLYGCVWSADSLAYYVGKGIGKRKLYKEVSPNKTVEGAFGSVIGGILSAVLLGSLLLKGTGIAVLAAIGCAIGVTTIIGDLVESMFKRDAGVKDSGSLIPGHGGILDKIDGVLFAGPVLFLITLGL
jgi:phosphatidate cytidylyltransferase